MRTTHSLLKKYFSVFFLLILMQHAAYCKLQTSWGLFYDVRYNPLISGLQNIPASNANVYDYFMNTSTGFVKYIKQEIATHPTITSFTVVFPARIYKDSATILFDLGSISPQRGGFTLNLVGYDTLPINQITSLNFDTTKIPKTSISCTNNAADSLFLTYNISGINFPTLKQFNMLPLSVFIKITNLPSQNPVNSVNVMGLRFEGINPKYNPPTVHPYFDSIYAFTGLQLLNFNDYCVDNNVFKNIYGDALYMGNGSWWNSTSVDARNNLKGLVNNNVVLNCWGLNPLPDTLIGGAIGLDNYGDGMQFNGLNNVRIRYNYIDNDIDSTGQFGRGGIVFQHNNNCTAEFNYIKGYDRNLHVETSDCSYYLNSNRSIGSFCSLTITEASVMEIAPMQVTNNYFSTEKTPIPTSFNPLHYGYPFVTVTASYSYPFIAVYNGSLGIGNMGTSANECLLKNNRIVMNTKDFKNWYDTSVNYYKAMLGFNIDSMKLECNKFESDIVPTTTNSISQMFSNNGGSFSSYAGNIFHGHFLLGMSSPLPDSNVVYGNQYITTTNYDAHFNHNPSQAVNCTTCDSSYINNSTVVKCMNLKSSNLIASYGNTIHNKQFYVDGDFEINASIAFVNCTFSFNTNASVHVGGSSVLKFDSCVLKSACGGYWIGLLADTASAQIELSNSTIRDAYNAVSISYNAVLKAQGNLFYNNSGSGIQFSEMNVATYGGYVWNNSFSSDSSIISFNGQRKALRGVSILNSTNINIGDAIDTMKGNRFDALYCGVLVKGNSNINGSLGATTNQIGIFNNSFTSISRDMGKNPPLTNTLYTNNIGAGVFIDYSACVGFDAHTSVCYTGHALPAINAFESCDKAIVSLNSNLIDSNLFIKNCSFGIMSFNTLSKESRLTKNRIENSFIGTQLNGNFTKYFIEDNIIKTGRGLMSGWCGTYPINISAPIGIDLKHFSNSALNTDTFSVMNNDIELPFTSGRGVSSLLGNSHLNIINNMVHFTATMPNNHYNYNDRSLYGIYVSGSDGVSVEQNAVLGTNDTSVYNPTFSKGLYFETSPNCKINCNKVRYTKQGLSAWGSNVTDSLNIKNNKFKFNLYPLYTSDDAAAQAGTFGQIGGAVHENGNEWLYNTTDTSWLQNGIFKVWRNSVSQPGYPIYTSPSLLGTYQTGSNNSGQYRYLVQPTSDSINDPCPDLQFILSDDEHPYDHINLGDEMQDAEVIAQHEAAYINYIEVGTWLNDKTLYDKLDVNETLRNSSSILSDFYANYKETNIGNIQKADLALASLADFSGEHQEMLNTYSEAILRNAEINGEEYENNERMINAIALRMMYFGLDSVSESQKMELAVLANTCPFIGGSAVYKARTLNAAFNPLAQYNDRLLCLQGLSLNKNGNGDYVNIDSLEEAKSKIEADALMQQIQQDVIKNTNHNVLDGVMIRVYPNPANEFVIIECAVQLEGTFMLYNALGELIKAEQLAKEKSTHQISLSGVNEGLYHYEIRFEQHENFMGKLTIIK